MSHIPYSLGEVKYDSNHLRIRTESVNNYTQHETYNSYIPPKEAFLVLVWIMCKSLAITQVQL